MPSDSISRHTSRRGFGARIRELARARRGFGIVAGTGTGKTLSIRPIAERPARHHRSSRRRDQPRTRSHARIAERGTSSSSRPESRGAGSRTATSCRATRSRRGRDPPDVGAELELCLALGKRVGCRFIWLSATVDPLFYARTSNAASVVESSVRSIPRKPRRSRSCALIRCDSSTTASCSDDARRSAASGCSCPPARASSRRRRTVGARSRGSPSQFYHGGEPIRVIRALPRGATIAKPYLLAMTAAGQSALNVQGLDTVVIDDTRFANVVERGRNVLTRVHLGANEILQMAGRVHGRVAGGRVFILSRPRHRFASLRPRRRSSSSPATPSALRSPAPILGCAPTISNCPCRSTADRYRTRRGEVLEARGIIENGPPHALRQGRRGDAGGSADGPSCSCTATTRCCPYRLRDERGRIAAPHDARGTGPRRTHRPAAATTSLPTTCTPRPSRSGGYVGEVYGLPRHLFDPARSSSGPSGAACS